MEEEVLLLLPLVWEGALEEDLLLLVLLLQHLVKPLKCMCTGAPLTVHLTHSHCLGKTPTCLFGAIPHKTNYPWVGMLPWIPCTSCSTPLSPPSHVPHALHLLENLQTRTMASSTYPCSWVCRPPPLPLSTPTVHAPSCTGLHSFHAS